MNVSETTKPQDDVDKKDTAPLDTTQDAVFGEITEDGPNYRNVLNSLSIYVQANQSRWAL